MAFEEIIGNEPIKELLKKTIETKNFLHSYLFLGDSGIGKFLFAKEFAKYALCLGEETCKSCLCFQNENHPDFFIIKPEGNSIKIEQIRQMQAKVQEKPILSSRKVYIIDESQTMTQEAQNCLLKTLEEPPEYVIIILICSNESKLLSTIKSRCTKMIFQKIEMEKMKKQLGDFSKTILEAANGSIGKAYQLREKEELLEQVKTAITGIEQKDLIDFVKGAEIIYLNKDKIEDVLEYLEVLLFEKAKTENRFQNCIQEVEQAKTRLKQNSNFDMTIDHMLFHIWEEIHEKYYRSSI